MYPKVDDVFDLPDQEEFLLHYVAVCSRAHPPPPALPRLRKAAPQSSAAYSPDWIVRALSLRKVS
jgi:hypothetical protein